MVFYNLILPAILILSSVPAGFLIAWLARDELIEGRKWFKTIIISFFIVGVWFSMQKETAIALTSFFIIVVSLISYWKSFDRKWVKKGFK